MGGLDVFSDSIHVNLNNPASYGDLKLTTYSLGVHYKSNLMISGDSKESKAIAALDYFNLAYNNLPSTDNSASLNSDVASSLNNDSSKVINNLSNYPLDCVIAYKADNLSKSYEISVCLESNFFMNKKKWDGGNDDLRYELGSDLRLDTQIIVQENGKITSSENSSIFK